MKKIVPIMFLHNIKKVNGGLHKAIYHRANVLANIYERVIIFTYSFDLDFKDLVEYHKAVGNIDPKVEVYNLYETNNKKINPTQYIKNSEYSYLQDEQNANSFRVFDENGRYAYYLRLRENNVVEFKDYFMTPWKRYKKDLFDDVGVLRKTIYMNDKNKPSFTVTFSDNEKPIVSSNLNKDTLQPNQFFYHVSGKQFNSEIEMGIFALGSFIDNFDNPIIFIDKREHVKGISKLSHPNLKKIFVLHSSHLDTPYTDISKFSPSVNDLFMSLKNKGIDKLVVLTREQSNDINEIIKLENMLHIIPHHQSVLSDKSEIVYKAKPKIISLARYHNAKNLTDAVNIIKKVSEKIPGVIYEIYGYGPDKEKLQKQINDLGLERNIFLKGHINNTVSKLKQSKIYLSTSKYEGFGLSLAESLACGVPVVSYNTKYGPSEVIRDTVDGYLIEKLDKKRIDIAAAYIIKILEFTKSEYEVMQKKAIEVTSRFNEKDINKRWINLIEELF